jgi:hypothetical protein
MGGDTVASVVGRRGAEIVECASMSLPALMVTTPTPNLTRESSRPARVQRA